MRPTKVPISNAPKVLSRGGTEGTLSGENEEVEMLAIAIVLEYTHLARET